MDSGEPREPLMYTFVYDKNTNMMYCIPKSLLSKFKEYSVSKDTLRFIKAFGMFKINNMKYLNVSLDRYEVCKICTGSKDRSNEYTNGRILKLVKELSIK